MTVKAQYRASQKRNLCKFLNGLSGTQSERMAGMTDFDSQITFVYVSDLARSAAFYGGVLKLEMVRDQGACHIYRVATDAYLGVCDHRPVDLGGVIITLVSDEVDAWAERLVAAGYTVDGPSANTQFGLYHCFVHDPDGHVVEIQRFDDPLESRAL